MREAGAVRLVTFRYKDHIFPRTSHFQITNAEGHADLSSIQRHCGRAFRRGEMGKLKSISQL